MCVFPKQGQLAKFQLSDYISLKMFVIEVSKFGPPDL